LSKPWTVQQRGAKYATISDPIRPEDPVTNR
jgi:hypothetical protein